MKITEWFKVAGQFIKTTSKSVVQFVKLNAKVVSIVAASTVVGVTTVTVGTVHIVQNNNEKNQPQSVAVTGLTVNTQTVELEVGETYTVEVNVMPENADNKTVIWSSSNTEIASVSDGVITGEAVGNAIVSVETQEKGYKQEITVTVVADIALEHIERTEPTCKKEGNIRCVQWM